MEIITSCNFNKKTEQYNWINLLEVSKCDEYTINRFIAKYNNKTSLFVFLTHTEVFETDIFTDTNYLKIVKIIKYNRLENKFKTIDNDTSNNLKKSEELLNYTGYPLYLRTIPEFDTFERNHNKHFVCHNSRRDYHRDEIVNFIISNNLENKIHLSYHTLNSGEPKPKEINKRGAFTSVTYEYYDSFCNIITDTYFNNTTPYIHFNEKHVKPIQAKIPFILVSPPYYLRKLKELGFQTFENWWNESYDEIENDEKRLSRIKKLILDISKLKIDKLNNMRYEMENTLNSNYNNLIKLQRLNNHYVPNDKLVWKY